MKMKKTDMYVVKSAGALGMAKLYYGNKKKLLAGKCKKLTFVDLVLGDYEMMVKEAGHFEYLLFSGGTGYHIQLNNNWGY